MAEKNRKDPKHDAHLMPDAGEIISGYLEGGRIITVSLLDFNKPGKDGSFLVREIDSRDYDVAFSLSETAIRFQCGNKTLELALAGEVFIKNKPFAEDISAESEETGEEVTISGVESLYIIVKELKQGVGVVYYKHE
jgi:hypothetical protein